MSRNVQHPKQFHQPFEELQPLEVSSYHKRIQHETYTWAKDCNLIISEKAVRRFVLANFSYLAAANYPRAQPKQLLQISKFLVLLFLIDDQVDDADLGHDYDSVYNVLYDILSVMKKNKVTTSKHNWSAYKLSFSEWWQEVSRYQSEDWRQRFRIAHADYFQSYLNETKNRTARRIPSIEEFTILRRETGAVRPCFCLIELEMGLKELTLEIFAHPTIQILENYSNDIICWTNDIFSCDKEHAKGDVHNMVIVVYHEKHCDNLQEAADIVSRMVIDRCNDFMKIRHTRMPKIKDIHPNFSDAQCQRMEIELEKYIEGCALCIIGSYEWSAITQRYSQQGVDEARANSAYVEDIFRTSKPIVAPPVAKNKVEIPEVAHTALQA